MLRYQSLKQRPRAFLSFTSLKVEEFDQLVTVIHSDWITQREERFTPFEQRKCREGGGRKYALTNLEDWLLLTLVWVRLYPAYIILEYLFGVDESTVSRVITGILP